MPKRTPLGSSDFKKIIETGRYYVDKTPMVRAIVEGAEIQLHCRPRRFGKTLNLSTLRYFFDCQGEYRHLFNGLAITADEEMMNLHQGKYPVIELSFKDVKAGNYTSALGSMAKLLYREWQQHPQLSGNPIYDETMADMNENIRSGNIRSGLFEDAILDLSKLLHHHYGAPVVLLIDEYDSPLITAWLQEYYEEMVQFMRTLLGGALKDNESLFKGVLTGILRVAKESLFSGLNNFISNAGLKPDPFCDKFGFTEPEVKTMLAHYGLNGREMEEITAWYDGYRYGGIPIYNPWSILNYVADGGQSPSPYWVNTGGHDLLKRLFFGREADVKEQLATLMRGESLYAEVDEFLTFRGLETNPNAILSLMYFAGYLRIGEKETVDLITTYELSIPNREVLLAYRSTLMAWFNEDLGRSFNDKLLDALTTGDVLTFGEDLAKFVLSVTSFYDTADNRAEHFYHAFLLGLLARLDSAYIIRSNGESGYGRYDICLIPRDVARKGIVMEIKAVRPHRGETLAARLAEAREQLVAKKYDTELLAHGVADILRLAIAVEGKEVVVEQA